MEHLTIPSFVGVLSRSTKGTEGLAALRAVIAAERARVIVQRPVARANRVASLVHVAVVLEQVLYTQLHGLVDQLVGLQRASSDGHAILACPAASMGTQSGAAPGLGFSSAGCTVPAGTLPRPGRVPAVSGARTAGNMHMDPTEVAASAQLPRPS